MQELKWLDSHFDGRLENGIERANQLYWYLKTVKAEDDKHWYVYAGDSMVLKTDSRKALDAFLYGMGLAYIVFPDEIFERLKKDVDELVGE